MPQLLVLARGEGCPALTTLEFDSVAVADLAASKIEAFDSKLLTTKLHVIKLY